MMFWLFSGTAISIFTKIHWNVPSPLGSPEYSSTPCAIPTPKALCRPGRVGANTAKSQVVRWLCWLSIGHWKPTWHLAVGSQCGSMSGPWLVIIEFGKPTSRGKPSLQQFFAVRFGTASGMFPMQALRANIIQCVHIFMVGKPTHTCRI